MGMRLRLRPRVRHAQLTGQARVIAVAMQRYGLIVADNGSNWFFQGAPSRLERRRPEPVEGDLPDRASRSSTPAECIAGSVTLPTERTVAIA